MASLRSHKAGFTDEKFSYLLQQGNLFQPCSPGRVGGSHSRVTDDHFSENKPAPTPRSEEGGPWESSLFPGG